MEAEARAHFPHETLNLTGEYVRAPVGYRYPKEQLGILDWVHPDPKVHQVVMAKRDGEVEQAVARARLVLRYLYQEDPFPKPIYIFQQTPLNLPGLCVLAPSPLRNNKLTTALQKAGGVLPLVPGWLSEHFPDLWKTEKAAEHWVARLTAREAVLKRRQPPHAKDISFSKRGLSTLTTERVELSEGGPPGGEVDGASKLAFPFFGMLSGVPAPGVAHLDHHQWFRKVPDWYWHLRASGGRLGLRTGRFAAAGIHARKPEGAAFLYLPRTAPEFALEAQFPEGILWVDLGMDAAERRAIWGCL
jgi:hypothetical protein